MIKKILKYYHTLKYVKPIQWRYRLFYMFRNKLFGYTKLKTEENDLQVEKLTLQTSITNYTSFNNNTFIFLNKEKSFANKINWDFSEYGKLWTYNLNYFDFLHQQDISKEQGFVLIDDFILQQERIKTAFEAYPISLRGINWIKFLAYQNNTHQMTKSHQMSISKINTSLYAQYQVLLKNLEYQHLANHLIENGFSLLFGAYFFNDKKLYIKAKQILKKELNEQILNDGAHYELSPMYHQIVLYRVLDCYNLVKNNKLFNNELEDLLKEKAEQMLSFLQNITFKNGDIPYFNDTVNGIAPTTIQLFSYASGLNLEFKIQNSKLKNSGYRKYSKPNYEIIIDAGNLGGVDYNLAHSHNDMLSFELYVNNKPIIVNTGISTYEKNMRRLQERQTSAHNTVMIDNKEQNQVWSGHRVAKRGKCIITTETENKLIAYHTGAKPIIHQREFSLDDNKIIITDKIRGKHKIAKAYLHFYPGILPEINGNSIIIGNISINFENQTSVKINDYLYAKGFNNLVPAKMLEIEFNDNINVLFNI